MDDNKGED
jgi:polo-like kinase 1